ncbi:MAG: GGDEF domain-containing protein [Campylobacterota bacterium]|nr:GGDEF domain-containing protein [Campylobacterota bacterium]
MNDDKILHIISNETKDSIGTMSVVTPSVYASIFSKYAKEHDTLLEDEVEFSKDLLNLECSTLTTLQEQTAKNAQTLGNSTSKAINAIKEKDESILNEVLKETQSLRAEIEKLKESVYKDQLTNLYNRRWLQDRYLVENSDEFKDSGTLAILDLNYFKIVNDTHGHIIGDKVLIFLSNALQKSGYKSVRYGGDEFIMMFPKNLKEEQVLKILNDIRESIVSKKLKAHKALFRTSFSIGISSYSAGDNLGTIIEIADKNMYEDKLEIKKRIPGIEVD